MSHGTIFSLLRYLAMSVAEDRLPKFSKKELEEKLISENFNYGQAIFECA